MEGVDAVDDLFERAIRDDSREYRVGLEDLRAVVGQGCTRAAEFGDEVLIAQNDPDVAAFP